MNEDRAGHYNYVLPHFDNGALFLFALLLRYWGETGTAGNWLTGTETLISLPERKPTGLEQE